MQFGAYFAGRPPGIGDWNAVGDVDDLVGTDAFVPYGKRNGVAIVKYDGFGQMGGPPIQPLL
ncbi:hypothetical protein GALL_531040 [mine drainage metagenome]|uniref:Uncharacterized protein n=1 Tax=mine drainage metagenome TaxID=410659 RepID=A0A1J5PJ86_9ZZZZ